jgi:hypothetical protein
VKLPGFAADTSLQRTVGRYRTTARHPGLPVWGVAAAQIESAPTRDAGSNGQEFCRPGCGRCNEVSPGRWQQICINPKCEERTVGCAPGHCAGPACPSRDRRQTAPRTARTPERSTPDLSRDPARARHQHRPRLRRLATTVHGGSTSGVRPTGPSARSSVPRAQIRTRVTAGVPDSSTVTAHPEPRS